MIFEWYSYMETDEQQDIIPSEVLDINYIDEEEENWRTLPSHLLLYLF